MVKQRSVRIDALGREPDMRHFNDDREKWFRAYFAMRAAMCAMRAI